MTDLYYEPVIDIRVFDGRPEIEIENDLLKARHHAKTVSKGYVIPFKTRDGHKAFVERLEFAKVWNVFEYELND